MSEEEHAVFRTYGMYVVRPPWPAPLPPNMGYTLDQPEARQAIGAHPPAAAHLTVAHVATLPDGTTVVLPAGTVLREAES